MSEAPSPFSKSVTLFTLLYAALEASRLALAYLTPLLDSEWANWGSEILVYVVAVGLAGYTCARSRRDWSGKDRERLAARFSVSNMVVGLALACIFWIIFSPADDGLFESFTELDLTSGVIALGVGLVAIVFILMVALLVAYFTAYFVLLCIERGLGGTAKPIGGEVS